MNLIINWSSPVPFPACEFITTYRRSQDPFYNTINTSGTTSGSTSSFYVVAPACYEGYIQSNCCGDNLSDQSYFGVNSYSPVSVNIRVQASPLSFIADITSSYGNSYNTIITGTYNASTSGATNLPFSITYAAGLIVTHQVLSQTPANAAVTVSNIVISSISAVFNNGGALQQYDSVNTPPYFGFYNGSIPTWNGSPITLPSFILRQFTVTTQDQSGIPLGGDLIISWIQDSLYNNATGIYTQVTFNIYDSSTALIGSTVYPLTHIGLNQCTVSIAKAIANISTSSLFTMKTLWGDTSISGTKNFYLPSF